MFGVWIWYPSKEASGFGPWNSHRDKGGLKNVTSFLAESQWTWRSCEMPILWPVASSLRRCWWPGHGLEHGGEVWAMPDGLQASKVGAEGLGTDKQELSVSHCILDCGWQSAPFCHCWPLVLSVPHPSSPLLLLISLPSTYLLFWSFPLLLSFVPLRNNNISVNFEESLKFYSCDTHGKFTSGVGQTCE